MMKFDVIKFDVIKFDVTSELLAFPSNNAALFSASRALCSAAGSVRPVRLVPDVPTGLSLNSV